jgi:hypothetical protein
MKKKQTRRSISVSGELYNALKAKAAGTDQSLSAMVEQQMRHSLGMEPRVLKSAKPDLEKAPEVQEADEFVCDGPEIEVPVTRKEPEEVEKAVLMRRQIAKDAQKRLEEAAAQSAKQAEEAKKPPPNSCGGVFTF